MPVLGRGEECVGVGGGGVPTDSLLKMLLHKKNLLFQTLLIFKRIFNLNELYEVFYVFI